MRRGLAILGALLYAGITNEGEEPQMSYIEVAPAYGREYTRQADVQADWDAGKDFRCLTMPYAGRYVNKSDADGAGLKVIARYGQGAAQGGGKVYAIK